jgi:uncharacterized membrane protein YwzB
MLISTALLLDSNIRNSVCTSAKLPCRRVVEGSVLKNSVPLKFEVWGLKRCSFDLVYFKYVLKKILTICLLLASSIIILSDQVCNYFLHYLQHCREAILRRFYLK